MPFLVIMCELFNGVLRPQSQMPVVWKYTMYYVAPFTYWIGGILSTVISGRPVVCSEIDLNFFTAPPGQTCAQYAGAWLETTTGYLTDPNAIGNCGYCKYSVADEVVSPLVAIVLCCMVLTFSSTSWVRILTPRSHGPTLGFFLALLSQMSCWF